MNMTTIHCEELKPGTVLPGSSSNIYEPAGTKDGAESDVGANPSPDRKQRQAKKNYTSPLDQSRSGLPDDPSQWRGRRIRSRKTGTVYIVRQVYNGGRVELEKNWMTYLTDVTTVQAEYESYA